MENGKEERFVERILQDPQKTGHLDASLYHHLLPQISQGLQKKKKKKKPKNQKKKKKKPKSAQFKFSTLTGSKIVV
jgi:hypothetical protein